MQQSFSHEFMLNHCGCYSKSDLMECSFMTVDPVSLSSILHSEIPLRDKYWFVCKQLATKEENQQIAIRIAEIVLPIYEKRYPENKAPREAIEAAKAYLAGHISLEKLLEKRRAAAAADDDAADADAAYAAYAAAAAADAAAAYAAYAAAAAAAADAAYAAAADAADAAYAAQIKSELENYLFTFLEEVPA